MIPLLGARLCAGCEFICSDPLQWLDRGVIFITGRIRACYPNHMEITVMDQIPVVHTFDSTRDAYEACQNGGALPGDVLVIPSERVIGIADTWPVAATNAAGVLHQVAPDYTLEMLFPKYVQAVAHARELATQYE